MLRWFWAVLAILLTLGSCSRIPTSEPPPIPEFLLPQGDRRPVEVVFASPRADLRETPDGALITLVFNQAMVPLAGLGASPAIPTIPIEPALPGKWEWRGTATLVFVPDARPPDATRFKVTVPAGLKSFVGETLAKDYSWEFATPKPALARSLPANEARFVKTDANLFLVFNQPVGENPTLRLQSGDKQVPLSVRRPTDEERKDLAQEDQEPPPADRVLVVDPTETLQLGKDYKLVVSGLGMEKEATIRFRTVDVLKVKAVTSEEKWRPDGSILIEFTNPVAPKELVAHLKFTPEVKIPDWYAEDDYARQEIWLYLPLEARTAYKMTVDAGLKDDFGQALGQASEKDFTTTDFSPALSMPEGLGILEAGGDLRLPVGLLNLDRLKVKMALLDEDEIVPVMGDDGFYRDGFEPPGGFDVEEDWQPDVPRNERVDRPVDLRKILKGKTHGFVYVQVETQVDGARWDRRALIQVSDVGVTAKFSPENTLVWTTTLGTGKPQADVAVQIRGKDNRVLWTGRSDAQGLAKAPGWAELGLRKPETWENPVQYVFAEAGDGATFVSSEGSTGISPWDFDIPYEWSPRARVYQGYGFTERGLYRAGEQVHFKGTVRRSKTGRWTVPDDVKDLTFTITDARDQKVQTGTVKLSDFGSFDHTLDLAPTAPSGFYSITYRLPNEIRAEIKEDGDLFSVSFRVEAYRPAQFEVKVEPGQPAYVLGDTATAKVTGRYLFGAAMSGDQVQWSARLEPTGFAPEDFAGFDFGPITFWNEDRRDQERVLVRDEGNLDAQGHREVSVSLKDIPFEGPASLVVEGTVTSASRQKVSGRASVPVHPAAFSVGLKAGGSLQQANKPVSVQVVSVDPAGKAVGGQKVDLQLIRRDWHSVRKAGAGGRYQWVSEAKDTDISTASTTTGTAAVEVPVTPPKSGLYLVRATGTDAKGRKTVSETYFYAWGGDYVAWAREDEDRIEIVPDKKRYAPGDTARILVKSPYEKAQALVTVERELVLDRFVVELEGTADTVEVPIRSTHLPNAFVSVLLVQGRVPGAGFGDDGMDLGKPSFKIGYANLPVESAEKRLKIEVTTDKAEYEPRQEATVTVQVRDEKGQPAKGEVCLAVVDEGVLSLIGYGTPSYFDSFYGERPLSVRTSESRLDVIGQRSYGSKGDNEGGGGGGLVGEYREDFVATAFWSPHLVTDDAGKAEVKFKLPDNLTRFRVMAVVQTMDSRFGSGEVGLTVQKPLLLQPSLPRFARRGDRFQAGVLVFNHTKASGEVLVEAQTAGLQLGEKKQMRVQVPAGQEKEVLFEFTAPNAGDSEVGFRASMGSHTDSLKLPIPVQRPQATEVVATSGTLEAAKAEEGLKLPGGILPGSAVLEAAVSGSSLAGLEGAVAELLDYPYGCLEQRLSKLVPLLVAEDLVTTLGVQDVDSAELRRRVQKNLDELAQFQLPSGGFSLWPAGKQVHDYLTAYAMTTLHEAKARGYKVDSQMVKRGRGYMTVAVNKTEFDYPYSRGEALTTRAYMLYALSLSDDAEASTHSALFSVRDEMPLDGQVFLLRALHPDDPTSATLVKELTSAAKVEAQTAYFADPKPMPWIFGSNVRTTGLVLQALVERGDFPLAPRVARWLMEARTDGHWGSTQEDVAALRALLAYAQRYEKKDPNFTAQIQVAGKTILDGQIRGRNAVTTARVALDEASGETLPLTVTRDGKGTLHYDLRLRYAPTQEPPARDQGFTVFKTVRSLDGKPVTGVFQAGQTYRVTLTVLTPSERRYVAVEDPVPAGFEVVQTTFETESDDMRQVLKDGGVKHPWMGTFHHFEVEDARVLLFADGLQAGEHTFEYLVRAMLPGQYGMPGTRAEEMYHPEVFGTTGAAAVEVR